MRLKKLKLEEAMKMDAEVELDGNSRENNKSRIRSAPPAKRLHTAARPRKAAARIAKTRVMIARAPFVLVFTFVDIVFSSEKIFLIINCNLFTDLFKRI